MGGGLTLSGIARPLKGGILVDLKRMDRILEVNQTSRYAVMEAGASYGNLQAYLKKHHNNLRYSSTDAPPITTVCGNILIHGMGHLSAAKGFHSEMLNGLEVVLPTGEIVQAGSCSASPYWFSRSPLPDLPGLFVGWTGTTGIVTKIAIKLYPARAYRDVGVFVVEDPEVVPDIFYRVTGSQVVDDVLAWTAPNVDWASGFQSINIYYSADTKRELTWKRDLVRASLKNYMDGKIGGFMMLAPGMKTGLLEEPQTSASLIADEKRGGGFEYVGAIMPIALFPKASRLAVDIAKHHRVEYSTGARVLGQGHCMMFGFVYPFNRADPSDMEKARNALEETNRTALEMGGIPWKAEASAQKKIIQQMDPNTFTLMNRIRKLLDPRGIMNPGNWELG
jgi:glycolate oxidase